MTTDIMLPTNIVLAAMQAWPETEVLNIKKKLGFKIKPPDQPQPKSPENVQLLQVYKFFMPWQLAALARDCGHPELAAALEDEPYQECEGSHESYVAEADLRVKEYCRRMRA